MRSIGYELQEVRDGRWVVVRKYLPEEREDALAAGRRLFNVEDAAGVRVLNESFDESRQIFVPQYVLRLVRPGVRIDRDGPAGAPIQTAAVRRGVTGNFTEQLIGGAGWTPPIQGEPRAAEPVAGPPPGSAGQRFAALAMLILGLVLEGLGVALALAILEQGAPLQDTRALWLGLAFGMLVAGLIMVVRQVGRLRDLGGLLLADSRATRSRPSARHRAMAAAAAMPAEATHGWREVIAAALFNRLPPKHGENASALPSTTPELAVTPPPSAEPPADLAPTAIAPPAPIATLVGFIDRALLRSIGDEARAALLSDPETRFAGYLFLRGAAEACVAAVGGADSEPPQAVLSAALDPLKLSAPALDGFAVRAQVFAGDQRYAGLVEAGRKALAAAMTGNDQPDALGAALAQWRDRAATSTTESVVLLALASDIATGGEPPDPAHVAAAFAMHQRAREAALNIYRGQRLGGADDLLLFRHASDAVAAAIELQARRLDSNIAGVVAPLALRAVALGFPVGRFERLDGAMAAMTEARAVLAGAIDGEVMVADDDRQALTRIGYRLGPARPAIIDDNRTLMLAPILWEAPPTAVEMAQAS
jgi:hypothetical protein